MSRCLRSPVKAGGTRTGGRPSTLPRPCVQRGTDSLAEAVQITLVLRPRSAHDRRRFRRSPDRCSPADVGGARSSAAELASRESFTKAAVRSAVDLGRAGAGGAAVQAAKVASRLRKATLSTAAGILSTMTSARSRAPAWPLNPFIDRHVDLAPRRRTSPTYPDRHPAPDPPPPALIRRSPAGLDGVRYPNKRRSPILSIAILVEGRSSAAGAHRTRRGCASSQAEGLLLSVVPLSVAYRERIASTDLESKHFAGQLVERVGWAVRDADQLEHRDDRLGPAPRRDISTSG